MKAVNDDKVEVITRLLELARLMRRRGTIGQSKAVTPYEELLERDLRQREAELAELPGLNEEHHNHKAVAA